MKTVTSKDGTSIAYDQTGNGPAVILVGGAFQQRMDPLMSPLAEQLSQDFTVINYDRRGRGDSTDTQPYEVEREVEDLAALIEAAGGSAAVFGMSSGAVLTLEAASRLKAIAKIALYEPPFIVSDGRPALPSDYRQQLGELLASGRRGDAVELFLTQAVGMPAEAVAPMRTMPFWGGMEAVAPTLAYDAAIMADTMSGQPLPRDHWSIMVPTLVMDGGASPEFMHQSAAALAELLGDQAERQTLAEQSHDVAAEVLAPVLTKFFQ